MSSVAPAIVLVRPQMGENIGAVARAMRNFGFSDLRLVAPRDGWPNPKAQEMAAHGAGIVEQATVHADLAQALADRQRVLASSARPRFLPLPVHRPEEGARLLRNAEEAGQRTALVFGPERSGLDNDALAHCHGVITIPTEAGHASLNIAQSAVLLCHAWFAAAVLAEEKPEEEQPATLGEIDALHAHLASALERRDFFRVAGKKPVMLRHLRLMLQKAGWGSQEVRTLRGMVRCLDEDAPEPRNHAAN